MQRQSVTAPKAGQHGVSNAASKSASSLSSQPKRPQTLIVPRPTTKGHTTGAFVFVVYVVPNAIVKVANVASQAFAAEHEISELRDREDFGGVRLARPSTVSIYRRKIIVPAPNRCAVMRTNMSAAHVTRRSVIPYGR